MPPLSVGGPPLIQQVVWPGVVAVSSMQYTCSHGITPGLAILRTYPQTGDIASSGNLAIGDGQHSGVLLKDCRVSRITGEMGSDGQTWTLEIQDRRWRWPALGGISGSYNQLDNRGKLVPWTIRSPYELAKLCLDAMGEKGWKVILPPGLTKADGKNIERFLLAGENFAQSLTNPETHWDHTPPAQALSQLADLYGCRVVFQPILNRVLVTPTGRGRPLPDGPCESIAGGAENPRVPYAVAVAGAPVRIQARFMLEAVGEEWDGSYKPIDDLSYAPRTPSQVQISTATYSGGGAPTTLLLYITLWPGAANEAFYTFYLSSGTVADKLTAITAAINADPAVNKVLTAVTTATVITMTAKDGGTAFGLELGTAGLPAGGAWRAALTQPAGPANGRSWRFCPPPLFTSVQATDRLSYGEALNLAKKSVFTCYRVLFMDPATGKAPLTLPWYKGKILRRQQIILDQTKVEQVVPDKRIPGAANLNNPAFGFLPAIGPLGIALAGAIPEFYNAYSRDREATVTGSVYKFSGGQVMWNGSTADWNTPIGARVYCGFSIDPYEQVVKFSDYVFEAVRGGLQVLPASLTLETGCTVTDAETGALVRWEEMLKLGGTAPIEWQMRNDVKVGVVGEYASAIGENNAIIGNYYTNNANANIRGAGRNKLVRWNYAEGDFEDATGRAAYYLKGMAAKYQLPTSDQRQLIGIYAIDPDGSIQQVSWSLGGGGPGTHVSANSEFSIAVPSFPTRRRNENLDPNAAAALANILERAQAQIPDPKSLPDMVGLAKALPAPPS